MRSARRSARDDIADARAAEAYRHALDVSREAKRTGGPRATLDAIDAWEVATDAFAEAGLSDKVQMANDAAAHYIDVLRSAYTPKRPLRAYHYIARIAGPNAVRFYHPGSGPPATSAARAFSAWAYADVTLWPTDERGRYRAQWFDTFADRYRETDLVIVEEQDLDAPRDPALRSASRRREPAGRGRNSR